jgi:Collagen triple helix repeat (20 copies)
MRRILRRCLSFALFTLLSASAFAQAPPTDDTYSNGNSKTQKNGSSIFLVVQHGFDSYIKFNLASLPANPNIAKATLRVYVDAVVVGGSFDVYQLNSSWNENTLTYNNAPALGTSATGAHPVAITASSMNQFVLIDITSLVQGWANGTVPNNGIALALTTSGGSFSFDSKESILTSHHPELEIALNGAVGPQGPAGPAGATGAMGPAGVAGAQGAQGPAGPTGAVGVQGPIGATGLAGATGAQGALGPQGPIGLTGATGPQGANGPQGPQGLIGLTGPQGTQGAAGTNGTGFNFTGLFSSSTSYSVNDVATYNGSTYVAIVANQGGNTPDQNTAYWSLMAQAGATGPAGPAGAQGAQGPQGATGATGVQGPAGPQGANGPQGPQGLMGLSGPQGPQGTQGGAGTNGTGFNFTGLFSSSTSYNVNDVATYNGSTYVAIVGNQGGNTPDQNTADWRLMAQAGAAGPAGPAGAQGAQGPQGNAGTTGAQGAVGPQGATGLTGATGAQGQPGAQGPTGQSGPAGPQGPTGPAGTTNIYFTQNASQIALPNTSYVAIDTLSLPAGSYWVSAQGTFLNQTSSTYAQAICYLTTPADAFGSFQSVTLGPGYGSTSTQGYVNLSAQTQVTYSCSGYTGVTIYAGWSQMSATLVTKITVQ